MTPPTTSMIVENNPSVGISPEPAWDDESGWDGELMQAARKLNGS